MIRNFSTRQIIFISGLFFFCLHLFLSFIFYQERMLQEDAPYYVVKMVNYNSLVCEHNRYSAFIYQWIPFLFFKMGASLRLVTISYSLAIALLLFVVFLYTYFALDSPKGSLLIMLFLALGLGRDFFLPINEYALATISSLGLFGISFDGSFAKNRWKILACILLIAVCLNFHPIGLIALGFILMYELISSDKSSRKFWLILILAMIAIWLIKKQMTSFDEYENTKLLKVTDLTFLQIKSTIRRNIMDMISYFGRYFPEIYILFIASIVFLIYNRKWKQLVLVLLYVSFLIPSILVLRSPGAFNYWFAEYFILLWLPVLLPVVTYLTSLQNKKYVLLTAMIVAISLNAIRTFQYSGYFTNKVEYIKRLLVNGSQHPEKRYIIHYGNVPRNYTITNWSIPFQTILLSSFDNKDSAQTFMSLYNASERDSLLNRPGYFLGPEWDIDMFNTKRLMRRKYFNLPKTTYKKLTTFNSESSDSVFTHNTVDIRVNDSSLLKINDSLSTMTIEIINHTNSIIHAMPFDNGINVKYHIYDSNGNVLKWENIGTPLECDVYAKSVTSLIIKTTDLHKNNYLVLDIQSANQRWWGINTRVTLVD